MLKNTRNVNSTTGSARTNIPEMSARFVTVSRAAQPRIEPTPVAVIARMAPTATPNHSRFANTPEVGPPKIAPRTITTTDAAAAIRLRGHGPIRDTSQPTSAATGSTNTTKARTNFSVDGRPAGDVDGVRAGQRHHQDRVGGDDGERGQRRGRAAPHPADQAPPPDHRGQSAGQKPVLGGEAIRRLRPTTISHRLFLLDDQQDIGRIAQGIDVVERLAAEHPRSASCRLLRAALVVDSA